MNEKIKAARKQLGGFLQKRRQQMGRSRDELATFLNISTETVKGIETGRFPCNIDQMLNICAALEIKPFFAPLEEIKDNNSTTPKLDEKEAFLLAINQRTNSLYILHRNYPACLIEVINRGSLFAD
jgi:DNA-binding XRE family transcriptional regulator